MGTVTEDKAATEAALEKLHTEVKAIATSEDWQAWLGFLGKLHNYSPNNRMWMWAQWEMRKRVQAFANFASRGAIPPLPSFSQAAGFTDWANKHDRQVRKGEKGLTVLCPIIIKDRETGEKKCIGFRLKAKTFEVSQTDGAELPADPIRCEELQGEGNDALHAKLVQLGESIGFAYVVEAYGDAHGFCDYRRKVIATAPTISGAQRDKTTVHELAHALLHNPDEYAFGHFGRDLNAIETEAESVAYVVMSALGIDSASYSFGYVASWSKGDGALIARTGERVLDTAERILTYLEIGKLPAAKGAARKNQDGTDKGDKREEVAA